MDLIDVELENARIFALIFGKHVSISPRSASHATAWMLEHDIEDVSFVYARGESFMRSHYNLET